MVSVFTVVGVLVVLYFVGLGVYNHFDKKEVLGESDGD